MQSLLKSFSLSTDKTNGLSKGYLRSIPSQYSRKYLMFMIFLKVLYFAIGSSFLDYLFLKLEKEMATHSSILAWRISWMEEPGGPATVHGAARVGHD